MKRHTADQNILVYLGTIDDVVLRFPWDGINITENFLIDTILDHVLFGNPLLINDGYLINHPLARQDLLKGENSLILALVKTGFIKVLTRVDDTNQLYKMPHEMAKNIDSFRKRINEEDWKRFKFVLKDMGESLRINENCYKWPPVDMGDGFRVLVENVVTSLDTKGFSSLGFRKFVEGINKRIIFLPFP